MGTRTTLHAESRNVVAALHEEGALEFGSGEALCLDKAAPILGYLIGADAGMTDLYYADCLDIGDTSFRGFSPETVQMLLQRLSGGALQQRLTSVDWEAEVAGQIYPFDAQDKKDECQSYILEHGLALKGFLESTVLQENGIISVEC